MMDDLVRLFAEVGVRVEHKIFMGFVPHQIIPASVARYFIILEGLEKVLENDSVDKSLGRNNYNMWSEVRVS